MATIQQMIKKIKPADMGTDLDSAIKFCTEHNMTYSEMQQAETCMLIKEQEKARERQHQREMLLNK